VGSATVGFGCSDGFSAAGFLVSAGIVCWG
jgi:hypothetical protein